MGMGEPLNNYDALVGALQGLREVWGVAGSNPNPHPHSHPYPYPHPHPH